ncbi:hypothetical protein [Salimicrobium flavidum]|uniref:hypothetical protein n=1 Tax=Salimicrobium flavidum TaxID=570947 RepID=UPI00117AAD28|nr:hypothetical protein [Salimicrobium flavidum]
MMNQKKPEQPPGVIRTFSYYILDLLSLVVDIRLIRWKLAAGMADTSRTSLWSFRGFSFHPSPAGVPTFRSYDQQ